MGGQARPGQREGAGERTKSGGGYGGGAGGGGGGGRRGEGAYDRPCLDYEELGACLHEPKKGMPCRYTHDGGYNNSKGAFLKGRVPAEGGRRVGKAEKGGWGGRVREEKKGWGRGREERRTGG